MHEAGNKSELKIWLPLKREKMNLKGMLCVALMVGRQADRMLTQGGKMESGQTA